MLLLIFLLVLSEVTANWLPMSAHFRIALEGELELATTSMKIVFWHQKRPMRNLKMLIALFNGTKNRVISWTSGNSIVSAVLIRVFLFFLGANVMTQVSIVEKNGRTKPQRSILSSWHQLHVRLLWLRKRSWRGGSQPQRSGWAEAQPCRLSARPVDAS